jgi:hypothetical protein
MKYPYLKTVHEEIADGGIKMLMGDMILFSIKTFLFVGVGWVALWCFTFAISDSLQKHLSNECIKEIANI